MIGSRVNVLDKDGKLVARQQSPAATAAAASRRRRRFALAPGTYRVEVLFSNGDRRARNWSRPTHVKGVIDEQTPKAE